MYKIKICHVTFICELAYLLIIYLRLNAVGAQETCSEDYTCAFNERCNEGERCTRECIPANSLSCSRLFYKTQTNYCEIVNPQINGLLATFKCNCRKGYFYHNPYCRRVPLPCGSCSSNQFCLFTVGSTPECKDCPINYFSVDRNGDTTTPCLANCEQLNGETTCECRDIFARGQNIFITPCQSGCTNDQECGNDARCNNGECTRLCDNNDSRACFELIGSKQSNPCSLITRQENDVITLSACNCVNTFKYYDSQCLLECENDEECYINTRCDTTAGVCTTECVMICDTQNAPTPNCIIENSNNPQETPVEKCVCNENFISYQNDCLLIDCDNRCDNTQECLHDEDGTFSCHCLDGKVPTDIHGYLATTCIDRCTDDHQCGNDARCNKNLGECTQICKDRDLTFCNSLENTPQRNFCSVVNKLIIGEDASIRCNCITGYGFYISQCIPLNCNTNCEDDQICKIQEDGSHLCECQNPQQVTVDNNGETVQTCEVKCLTDSHCSSEARCDTQKGECTQLCHVADSNACDNLEYSIWTDSCSVVNRVNEDVNEQIASYECNCQKGFFYHAHDCIEIQCEECENDQICAHMENETFECQDCQSGTVNMDRDGYPAITCQERCNSDDDCGSTAKCRPNGKCTRDCDTQRINVCRLIEHISTDYCKIENLDDSDAEQICVCEDGYKLENNSCVENQCSPVCSDEQICIEDIDGERNFCKCNNEHHNLNKYGHRDNTCRSYCSSDGDCGSGERCDSFKHFCTVICQPSDYRTCASLSNASRTDTCVVINSSTIGEYEPTYQCNCNSVYTYVSPQDPTEMPQCVLNS